MGVAAVPHEPMNQPGDRGQHERRIAADEEGRGSVGTFFPLLEGREEGVCVVALWCMLMPLPLSPACPCTCGRFL